MRSIITAMALCCILLAGTGCAGRAKFAPYSSADGNADFFYETDTRAKNQEKYFKDEFQVITKRLSDKSALALGQVDNATRPQKMIGIGLSGGGFRSNAFQLGFLSGLEAKRDSKYSRNPSKTVSLLDNVSYLSGVSGGSWAMAAVAVNATANEPKQFFGMLDDYVIDRRRTDRQCDDAERTSSLCKCQFKALCVLNNAYTPILKESLRSNRVTDPFDLFTGFFERNPWRELLLEFNLLGKDASIASLGSKHNKAPFVIFNSTHSSLGMGTGETSFTFQMTPFGVATMSDCGNTNYCKNPNEQTGFFRKYDNENFPVFAVSQAMAMAGAVAPERFLGRRLNLMEWTIPLPPSGPGPKETDPVQRDTYTLGDGGHSENFGALALLERGADLVIISDAGYDPKYDFKDYSTLKSHADRLLSKRIVMYPGLAPDERGRNDWLAGRLDATGHLNNEMFIHTTEAIGKGAEKTLTSNVTLGVAVTNANKSSDTKQQLLLYVRPAYYQEDNFIKHLRKHAAAAAFEGNMEHGAVHTYRYLASSRGNFPNDKTIVLAYERELIFAYYWLGKYIAENEVAPILDAYLTRR